MIKMRTQMIYDTNGEKRTIVEKDDQIHKNTKKKSQTFQISACNNNHIYIHTRAYYALKS